MKRERRETNNVIELGTCQERLLDPASRALRLAPPPPSPNATTQSTGTSGYQASFLCGYVRDCDVFRRTAGVCAVRSRDDERPFYSDLHIYAESYVSLYRVCLPNLHLLSSIAYERRLALAVGCSSIDNSGSNKHYLMDY